MRPDRVKSLFHCFLTKYVKYVIFDRRELEIRSPQLNLPDTIRLEAKPG